MNLPSQSPEIDLDLENSYVESISVKLDGVTWIGELVTDKSIDNHFRSANMNEYALAGYFEDKTYEMYVTDCKRIGKTPLDKNTYLKKLGEAQKGGSWDDVSFSVPTDKTLKTWLKINPMSNGTVEGNGINITSFREGIINRRDFASKLWFQTGDVGFGMEINGNKLVIYDVFPEEGNNPVYSVAAMCMVNFNWIKTGYRNAGTAYDQKYINRLLPSITIK